MINSNHNVLLSELKENVPSQKILVSICCLAYNHENYIRECLDGFLMQKCDFNYEILIHDDASTDNTANIIKEYEAKYPDIIKPIYQKENQWSKGVRITSKFNFSRAQGKYIAMCEGDDYWIDPLKLQKQVSFLEANDDFNFSVGKVYKLYKNTKKFSDTVNPYKKSEYTVEDYIKGVFSQTSSFIFRNNVTFPDWFNKVHAGDQSVVIIVSKGSKIKYHNDFFSVYRINQTSVSFTTDPKIAYHKSVFFLNSINSYTEYKYNTVILLRKINNYLFFVMKRINTMISDFILKVLMKAVSYLIKLI